MAGVRYRSEFTSNTGVDWKLDIYDADYTGSVNTFTVAREGFTWRVSLRDKDKRVGVLGAEIIVHAINLDATFNGMLVQMAQADESRFVLNVYKDSAFFWSGALLMDLYTEEDRPKALTDITFTDGLARLKDIDYANSGAPYSGDTTVIEHIWNCLNQLPTFSQWGASDVMLSTAIRYFDTQMTYSTSTDPLEFIRIPQSAFYSKDSNSNNTFKSCYDVLENISVTFGAILVQNNGYFCLIQADEFRQSSVKQFQYYPDSTSHDTTITQTMRSSVDQSRAGIARLNGRYEYFAGLKKVEAIYLHNSSGNFLTTPVILNAAAQNLGNVDTNGGDARFFVKGSIKLLVSTSASQVINVRVKFKIKHNTYYLKRDASSAADNTNYSGIQWTTTSTDTATYYTGVVTILTTGTVTVTKLIPVDFATPYLQTTGDVEVSLESLTASDVFDAGGTPVTTGVTLSGNFTGYIEYKTDDNAESERTYYVDNSAIGDFSKTLTLDGLLFGDAINSSTKNALEVYNGSSWVASSSWKKKNTGTAYKLLQLLINELLSMQRTGVKKLYCDLRGDTDVMTVLEIGSEYYAFLAGSFTAGSGIWTGAEYVKTGFDNTSLSTGDYGIMLEEAAPSQNGSFGSGGILDQTTEIKAKSADIADANDNINIGTGVIGGGNNINIGGAIGSGATGNYNFTVGKDTGQSITSGGHNLIIGYQAGKSLTTANYNSFFGYQAGYNVTSAVGGNYLGFRAGYSTTTGESNNFIGRWAGYSNTTGLINNYIGYQAGYSGTTAQYNNALGYQVGYSFTSARYNNLIGFRAGRGTTSGRHNNFIGYDAGYSNTTAYYNIGIGYRAGYSNTTSQYNVSIGYMANYSGTGEHSIAIGRDTNTATYNNSFVLGRGATATASNQFVIGSSTYNLGSFTNESVTSDYTITVRWNDKDFKILAKAI